MCVRCGVGADIPPPDPPTTDAAHHLGHELLGKQSTWKSTCGTGDPYPLSSDAVLASIAVGYPIGSTNVEPRQGYETLQSVHVTELKHPNQGKNVRERFVNSLDSFGATLTSFTFGSPKALPRGARLRSREKEKLPPRQSIVAPKEVQRGLLSGGCGLEAESERQVLVGVKSHELTLRVYIIP